MNDIQLIQSQSCLLDEGFSMELHMNHLNDAVLIVISPSSEEHHWDVDLTGITIDDLQWLESTSIDVIPYPDEHLEPLQ